MHAGHQFDHRKRLDDVVIRADREAAHPLRFSCLAVTMMIGKVRVVSRARKRRQISMPETPGSIQSRMRRSGALSTSAARRRRRARRFPRRSPQPPDCKRSAKTHRSRPRPPECGARRRRSDGRWICSSRSSAVRSTAVGIESSPVPLAPRLAAAPRIGRYPAWRQAERLRSTGRPGKTEQGGAGSHRVNRRNSQKCGGWGAGACIRSACDCSLRPKRAEVRHIGGAPLGARWLNPAFISNSAWKAQIEIVRQTRVRKTCFKRNCNDQ